MLTRNSRDGKTSSISHILSLIRHPLMMQVTRPRIFVVFVYLLRFLSLNLVIPLPTPSYMHSLFPETTFATQISCYTDRRECAL